jgi:hypothetical protein
VVKPVLGTSVIYAHGNTWDCTRYGQGWVLIAAAGYSRGFRNWWDAVPGVTHSSGNTTKREKERNKNEEKRSIQTTSLNALSFSAVPF